MIRTQKGGTPYRQGDYLVWDDAAGLDGHAISKATFEILYQLISDDECSLSGSSLFQRKLVPAILRTTRFA